MAKTLLTRVQQLSDFVFKQPIKEQLVVYLSEHACPLGEIAGVNAISIHEDVDVVCTHADGFERNEDFIGLRIPLTMDTPATLAMRQLKVLSGPWTELLRQHPNFPMPIYKQYESGVVIPVGLRHCYVLSFQHDISSIFGFDEYISCIRSLLEYFENTHSDSATRSVLKKENTQSDKLTDRQEVIVDRIRNGKTNVAIAVELGYSESLIRKETIIIYRKLGVDGRRELV